ncbi:MAG: YCF48-related protein [Bacteroidia bacterium]
MKKSIFFESRTNKFLFALTVATLFSFGVLRAGWYQPSQSHQSQLNKVRMASSTVGYAISKDYGSIFKTIDGGLTWKGLITELPLTDGYLTGLNSLDFVDENVGYVVGQFGLILKTMDGGRTWQRITISTLGTNNLYAVDFISSELGFVAGDQGYIFKTNDGGKTWNQIATGISTSIAAIQFVDATTGWFSGAVGIIKKTVDGGSNWITQNSGSTSAYLHSLSFVSPAVGFMASDDNVYKTTNGGDTWSLVHSNNSISDLHFIDANTGYFSRFANSSSGIYKTTDGGVNWSVAFNSGGYLKSVHFGSASTGVACGSNNTIYTTSDAGASWAMTNNLISYENLYGIGFDMASSTGWIGGAAGNLIKSTDGGETWASQTSGTTNAIFGICALSSSTAWLVGVNGMIKKTIDGGATWTSQTSGLTTQAIYDIKFVDASNGICVAADGKILRTTNGGTTWTSVASGTINVLRNIHYASSSIVYVVGHSGTILKSTDGGASWTAQNSGTTNSLFGVAFTSTTVGFACGLSGVLLKTTDGGASWAAQASGVTSHIGKIVFTSANNGWIVGNTATILRTKNGGASWTINNTSTYDHINHIAIVNNTGDLMVLSQNGVFAKFTENCPALEPTIYATLTDTNICNAGQTATLIAKGEGAISWYSSASGNTFLASGENFITPSIHSNTTFYVQDSTCSASPRKAITVYLIQAPTLTASSEVFCDTSSTVLTANTSNGVVNWYTTNVGGSSIATGNTFTTPVLNASTTYYIDATYLGCTTSSRVAVYATMANPVITSVTNNALDCDASDFVLNATASEGIIDWYTTSTGGNSIAQGNSYTTPVLDSTTTFYVDATQFACTTPTRTPVVVTIPKPVITSVSNATICGPPASVTVGATASEGTVNWYTDEIGGSSILSGSSGYETPILNTSTTYYVDATSMGCTTPNRVPVQVSYYDLSSISIIINGTTNGTALIASLAGVSYQWLDCNNGYAPIAGATSQSYTTTVDGSYAVMVSTGGCSDTSACMTINTTGITDSGLIEAVRVYPNPFTDELIIEMVAEIEAVKMYSIDGKCVGVYSNSNTPIKIETSNFSRGIYFIEFRALSGNIFRKKIVKN